MRVLCLDPGGILGGLPSPVLFPEYGDRFVQVPELGGEHADALSSFLHASSADDSREIWVLWKPGDARFVIERVARQLYDRLDDANVIAVYGVLVTPVKSGPEKAGFFSAHQPVEELNVFAGAGHARAKWNTLALGYQSEPDQSGSISNLMVALSLRCWLDRLQLSKEWKATHYRALVEFSDEAQPDKLLATLLGVRKDWQEAYSSLWAREKDLRSTPCNSRLLGEPKVSWLPFANRISPAQQLLCSLPRCLTMRSENYCLTCFLRDVDREIAHRWLGGLHLQLENAIRSSWKEADTSFRVELRRIHDDLNSESQSGSLNLTPWEKVLELEVELAELSASDPANPSPTRMLFAEIERAQRGHLAQLFEALRCRPTRRNFLGWLGGSIFVIASLTIFREIATTVIQVQAFDGSLWLTGAMLMGLVGAAWGLWNAQRPVQRSRDDVVSRMDAFWRQAELLFADHTTSLGRELKKVVTLRNLEIVRTELGARNLELAQIEYHIDRLAIYYKAYGGDELIAKKSDSIRLPLAVDQPEAANSVYQWRNRGIVINTETLPDHNAPKVWENDRLAGVRKFSVKEIAPIGRVVAGEGNK